MSNVHGAQRPTVWSDKGIGVSKSTTTQGKTGGVQGGNGGTTVAGHARNHAGNDYIAKPSIKRFFTDHRAYREEGALFKQQRVAKHRDRVMEELGKPQPDPHLVKASLRKLSSLAHGSPMRFYPAIPKDDAQRNALHAQMQTTQTGIATMRTQLHARKDTRFDNGLKVLDAGCGNVLDRLQQVKDFEKKAGDFGSQRLDVSAGAVKKWQFSGDGGAGAILVRNGKAVESVMKAGGKGADTADAMRIGGVINNISAQASDKLPFEFPQHKVVKPQVSVAQAQTAMTDKVKSQWKSSLATVRNNLEPRAAATSDQAKIAKAKAAAANLDATQAFASELAAEVKKLKQDVQALAAKVSRSDLEERQFVKARTTYHQTLAAYAPLLAMSGKMMEVSPHDMTPLDKTTTDQLVVGAEGLRKHWENEAKLADANAQAYLLKRDQLKTSWESAQKDAATPELTKAEAELQSARDAADKAINGDSDVRDLTVGKRTEAEDAVLKARENAKNLNPSAWQKADDAQKAYKAAEANLTAALKPKDNADKRAALVDSLTSELRAGTPVLVQTGVSGVVASRADPADKIAAFANQRFGREIGMNTFLGPLLGLGDHLAPNNAGACNFGNVMLNKGVAAPGTDTTASLPDYHLGFIDFAPPVAKPELGVFTKLVTDLKRLSRSDSRDLSSAMAQSSLGELHEGLLGGGPGGMFFLTRDQAKRLTPDEKNRCVGNVLAGLVQGIEYFERNREVFANAHAESGGSFDADYFAQVASALTLLSPADREALKKMSSDSSPASTARPILNIAPPSYEESQRAFVSNAA